ncbi:hypothetical protein IE53DRAFT_367208 [Violaceomyces palustris]|uniref:Uncharacterized protein n=1 Tax=Violaceomyces palustris TaxID=1673888 RepID=A0ACD0P370_9BASI|nr:hypothetical protein IE53DRAFT_367208 [Violaceomyces palustris]
MPPRRETSPDSRGGGLKLTKQQAKSLRYEAPHVPKFLQALKDQVNNSSNYGSKGGSGGRRDEFDDFFSPSENFDDGRDKDGGRASMRGKSDPSFVRGEEGEEEGEEDDLEGAQIVVLKEGRHLTREEMEEERERIKSGKVLEKEGGKSEDPGKNKIAQAGSISNGRKRASAVITSSSAQEEEEENGPSNVGRKDIGRALASKSSSGLDGIKALIEEDKARKRAKLEEEKRQKRDKKNKAARAEKKKAGKGLSFDIED